MLIVFHTSESRVLVGTSNSAQGLARVGGGALRFEPRLAAARPHKHPDHAGTSHDAPAIAEAERTARISPIFCLPLIRSFRKKAANRMVAAG